MIVYLLALLQLMYKTKITLNFEILKHIYFYLQQIKIRIYIYMYINYGLLLLYYVLF